jgi:hypothetical protein
MLLFVVSIVLKYIRDQRYKGVVREEQRRTRGWGSMPLHNYNNIPYDFTMINENGQQQTATAPPQQPLLSQSDWLMY